MGRALDTHIQPQAIDLPGFTAAAGTTIGISNLHGSQYAFTSRDGAYAMVDVSAETVEIAQTAIQKAIDSLTWV
jgi:hypothetical protein